MASVQVMDNVSKAFSKLQTSGTYSQERIWTRPFQEVVLIDYLSPLKMHFKFVESTPP